MNLFPELIPFLIASLAAFFVGVGKTGVPSLSLLFNALMIIALPTKEALGMVLLLLVVGDLFAVFFYRKHADWKVLLGLLPSIAIGLLIGTFLLNKIPNDLIKPVIGAVVLSLFCLDQALKRGLLAFDNAHPVLGGVFGSLMGVTTVVGNSAGPVSSMYFMLLKFDKYKFMGTSAWLFCIVNLSKVPLLMSIDVIGTNTFYSLLFLLPFVFVGAFSGRLILKMIPEKFFSVLVMVSVLGASSYFLIEYFLGLI